MYMYVHAKKHHVQNNEIMYLLMMRITNSEGNCIH